MPPRPDDYRRGPTRVFLVRHGQSTFNAQQRYQGRSDEPVLTERGAAAAALTGRHLARRRFDAVISSPLRRAHQTAGIILGELGGAPPIETSDDLRELDLGAWQGKPIEDVKQRLPESYRAWRDRPHELRMTAADGSVFFPVRDLFEQAFRFWGQFLPRHAGQTVLVVTHGGTARALIGTAIGIGVERFQALQHSNCGISILEFPAGSATAEIAALNLTAHLGEVAPKLKQGKRGLRVLLLAGEQPAEAVQWRLRGWHAEFACSAGDAQSKNVAAALVERSGEIVPGEATASFEQTVQMRLRDTVQAGTVATGVFVGPGDVLSGWLANVLQIEGGRRPWKPFGTAVLHYPGLDQPPVIQTFHPTVCEEAQP
jgi:probable phosphoglycerate mutase